MALAPLAAGPVVAQSSSPSPSPETPTATPADALPAIGHERLFAEMLDLEPAGEPVVSPVTAKGAVVLRAPLRLRSEGRLAAEIATDSYRMAAGAPVVHRKFKQASPDLAEAIEAWCGPGEQKTMFGWAGGITVCMVHTSDGKANLGSPQLHIGSWWMASHVGFLSPDARTERVAVLPPESPSAFSLVIVYERLRPEGVAVHSAIEGPGLSPDARPSRYRMPRRILPMVDGQATLDYDGFRIGLRPERRGDVVAATGERVSPSADFRILRSGAAAAVAGEDGATDALADDLAPTPFVIGGVRIDSSALKAAAGVVGRGGVVLSGQADYAVTARLAQPLNLRAPLVNDTAPEGLIVHQLEFARTSPLGARSMTRIWCGPIGAPTVWSRQRVTMCLRRGGPTGLEAFWPSTGRPWLGTTQATGSVAALRAHDFSVAQSPTSLLDPLGFRIDIQRITDTGATLRLFVRHGDEDALIFTATPEFEDGTATLPLWTHRLRLTRSGGGLTATLTADGDGEGPVESGFYP